MSYKVQGSIVSISEKQMFPAGSGKLTFKEGIDDLIGWIKSHKHIVPKPSQNAMQELKEKGLLK